MSESKKLTTIPPKSSFPLGWVIFFVVLIALPYFCWHQCIDWIQETTAPLKGINGWSYARLRRSEPRMKAVLKLTGGVELPSDAHGIWTARYSRTRDPHDYLIFRTSENGAEAFVRRLVDQPLIGLPTAPATTGWYDCPNELKDQGFPWKAENLRQGRYGIARLEKESEGRTVWYKTVKFAVDVESTTVHVVW